MKLSRHAITVLTRQYKSVLLKCALINAGLFLAVTPAMATSIVTTGGTDSSGNAFDSQPIVNVTGLSINDTSGLQTALDAKLNSTTAASTYLTQANASSTYETQAHASSTYETQGHAASTYETQAHASSTYETQAHASSTYLTQANASSTYLTQANATSTYLTQTNAATTYLTQANASSTYATLTALSAKQDTISDLETIRANATAGAGAATTIATYGDIVTHNVSDFATAAQGAKADNAITYIGSQSTEFATGTALAGRTVATGAATDITVANALGSLNGAIKTNSDNIATLQTDVSSLESLVGTDPTTGTGILAGKTITGTTGTNNLNVISALNTVAGSAAAKDLENTFSQTNTFGTTAGQQVVITNGGSMSVDKNLTVGLANPISSTVAGKLDMGENMLTNVKGLILTDGSGHTATLEADENGINTGNANFDAGTGSLNSQTLNVGSTDQFKVNADGNLTTSGSATVNSLAINSTGKGFDASGNLTAGTVKATGIDTTEANTVKLGGTSFTTDVTGNMSVSGNTTLTGTLSAGATTIAATGTTAGTPVSALAVTAENTADTKSASFNVTSDGVSIIGNTSIKGDTTMEGDLILSDGTNSFTLGAAEVDIDMLDGTSATDAPVLSTDGDFLAEGIIGSAEGLGVFKYNTSTGRLEETFDVDVDGNIKTLGTLSVSDGKFTVDGDGAVSAADGNFTVDAAGKVTAAGGADITGTTTLLNSTDPAKKVALSADSNGDLVVDHGINAAGGNFTVDASTGDTDIAGSLKVGSSDQFQVSDAGAVTTTSTLSADGESKFGKIGDTTNYALDVVSGTDAASSTVTANAVIEATQGVRFGAASTTNPVMTSVNHDTAIAAMDTADTTTTTGNNVVASAQAVAKTRDAINAEVNGVLGGIYKINDDRTVSYDATALDTAAGDTTKAMFNTNGTTAGADLTASLGNLANNINAITGGTISATDGTVNNNYAAATSISYNTLAATGAEQIALAQAIGQVDKNIGAAITGVDRSDSLAGASTAATNSVNANINALDVALGNLDYTGGTINYTNGTGSVTTAIQTINANIGAALTTVADRNASFKLVATDSVNENLAKLDAAIGNEVNATYNNITKATSVNANLDSLDAAIGDRSFATTHYVAPHDDLSTAVTKLDSELHTLNHDVRKLRHDMNRGLASVAALSALVPNARGTGNTSLSVGTGHYHGQTAMALGGAHWFTDNLMVNVGVASTMGHTRDATYRAGVSYSF